MHKVDISIATVELTCCFLISFLLLYSQIGNGVLGLLLNQKLFWARKSKGIMVRLGSTSNLFGPNITLE